MFETLVQVAHDTIEFAVFLGFEAEDCCQTVCVACAFVAAYVHVHGAVACGLVSMEVTFAQEAFYAVAKYAIVTLVVLAVDVTVNVVAVPEVDVIVECDTGHGIIAPALVFVLVCERPDCANGIVGTFYRSCFVLATDKQSRIVGVVAVHMGVGVYRDKEVEIVTFHLTCYFVEAAVVSLFIACADWIRAKFHMAHHNVVAHIQGGAEACGIRVVLVECAVYFKTVFLEFVYKAEAFPQVCVGFEETGGIGISRVVRAVFDGRHGTVAAGP